MTRSRPKGIYVVGALMVLGALWGILQGLAGGLLGLASLGSASGWGLILVIVSTFLFFISLGKLAVAYGLLTFQSWGWTWTMILVGFGLVLDVVQLLSGEVAVVISMGISGCVLWYVYAQKDHFKSSGERHVPEANRI